MNACASHCCTVAARVATVVLLVAGTLYIGYAAPVHGFKPHEDAADASAAGHDNGPTGYFPDMFELDTDAESVEHVEAF